MKDYHSQYKSWILSYFSSHQDDIINASEILEIKMTERRKAKYSGINAFLPYWKELKSLFGSLEKKINDQEE